MMDLFTYGKKEARRKECAAAGRKRYAENPVLCTWKRKRTWAKKRGIPFDITVDDIATPKICPVLGIPLYRGKGRSRNNSPSLDRIIPDKGYVKGNVVVVSQKANMIKNDATIDELMMVADFYSNLMAETQGGG